jgi:macrolide-specific efflux system membrane fusion protein
MKTKNKISFVVAVVVIIAVLFVIKLKYKASSGEVTKEIALAIGTIQQIVSTTGTVLPQNRLEIKPPVNGRIDQILVKEGEKVEAGQILAWMSSTERAALLDAARGQGEGALKYWQDVYKTISLISPIEGEVIVATTQPGQTVTNSDVVVVLSDHLIARAQVDETDIGKIKLGQDANISLDAYPDTKIKAKAEHIYYESKLVNNVTIYDVDLIPENVPLFFRSGMNATVDFIIQNKENILLIPVEAVHKEKQESFVYVKQNNSKEPLIVRVKLGISDDKSVEIISGVSEKDIVMITGKKYSLPKSDSGSNPFMPARRR